MKIFKILIAFVILIIAQPIGFICQCFVIGFYSGQQLAMDIGEKCNKELTNENIN